MSSIAIIIMKFMTINICAKINSLVKIMMESQNMIAVLELD